MAAHFTSMNTPDWGTPPAIVEAARKFMGGIDLDPASSASRNQVVKADKWLGLEHVDPEVGIPCGWGDARRIFINPPGGYTTEGQSLSLLFWNALGAQMDEVESGAFIWVAYNINQLQTLQTASEALVRQCCVCVPNRRVKYLDTSHNAKQGAPSASAIVGFAWGGQTWHWSARFIHTFERIGAVWQPR